MILPVFANLLVNDWAPLPSFVANEVQVVRGAPVGGLGPGNWVFVEWDGRPDAEADARVETTFTNLAATSIAENGEITCSSVSQSGNVDIAAQEAQALAQVGACIARLNADRTVGGIVHNAYIATATATQLQNRDGIAVVVPFTVAYFATYAASAA